MGCQTDLVLLQLHRLLVCAAVSLLNPFWYGDGSATHKTWIIILCGHDAMCYAKSFEKIDSQQIVKIRIAKACHFLMELYHFCHLQLLKNLCFNRDSCKISRIGITLVLFDIGFA